MAAGYNKKTRALSEDEYKNVMEAIMCGFKYTDDKGKVKTFRPNKRLAVILQTEAVSGMRIGDVLKLRMSDIVRDGERFRLDVIEEKTGKKREFTVKKELYNSLKQYGLDNDIPSASPLFAKNGKIPTERAIQKQLAIVCQHLRLDNVSTHSFRKMFATKVYTDSGYNVRLVQQLLQHSSITTTQRYLGTTSKQIEDALQGVSDSYILI